MLYTFLDRKMRIENVLKVYPDMKQRDTQTIFRIGDLDECVNVYNGLR